MAIKTSRKRKLHRRVKALARVMRDVTAYTGEERFLAKLEKAIEHARNLKAKLS